jgi:hypothetical protein
MAFSIMITAISKSSNARCRAAPEGRAQSDIESRVRGTDVQGEVPIRRRQRRKRVQRE